MVSALGRAAGETASAPRREFIFFQSIVEGFELLLQEAELPKSRLDRVAEPGDDGVEQEIQQAEEGRLVVPEEVGLGADGKHEIGVVARPVAMGVADGDQRDGRIARRRGEL